MQCCLVCSGSGKCPCPCNYAVDATCQCRNLAEALNVTITKSAVYASYPLIYQQAFNYQPYEVCATHYIERKGKGAHSFKVEWAAVAGDVHIRSSICPTPAFQMLLCTSSHVSAMLSIPNLHALQFSVSVDSLPKQPIHC